MSVSLAQVAEGRILLRRRGWLSRTPQEFTEALLDRGQWRIAERGDAIITAGQTGGLCGIARGSVEISDSGGPPDSMLVHMGHGGTWVGSRPLLTGRPRRLSVVALGSVLWMNVPLAAAQAMLHDRTEWWQFIGQLAEEGGELATAALADMTLADSQRRAVAVLLRLAGCRYEDVGGIPRLNVTQQQLSEFAAMSRQTASAILRRLEDQGLIELHYHELVLVNPAVLRAMVDGV